MLSESIELVIFDCDGVLIDSEVISARVIVDMLRFEGVVIDLAYVYKNFLGQRFSCVGQKVLQDFLVELPDSFESDYRQELLLAFKKQLKKTEGVMDVLSNLRVPYCLATSSGRRRTQGALELVGLTEYFGNHIFTASEVAHGKPAPDLFLFASKKMQVEPEKCLVIEDSVPGVMAAIAAEMRVWRYTGASHLKGLANDVSDDLTNVPVFDSWKMCFEMAPCLRTAVTCLGNQHDN